MENFEFFKECLRDFDYPQFYSMTDEEIMEIFSNVNREFLVIWILRRIDESYKEAVDNAKKSDLANIIHSAGFCNASEKDAFMNGTCDVPRQFEIINQMLQFMKNVSDARKVEKEEVVAFKEIDDLLNFDTNLFAMFSGNHILKVGERRKKITEFRKEVAKIQEIAQNKRQNNYQVDPKLKEKIDTVMSNLEANFDSFKMKLLYCLEHCSSVSAMDCDFNAEFVKILDIAGSYMRAVIEFFRSASVIQGYKDYTDRFRTSDLLIPRYSMLRDLIELIREIDVHKRISYN